MPFTDFLRNRRYGSSLFLFAIDQRPAEYYCAQAREAYEAAGPRIIDATLGGACRVFGK